MTPRRRRWSIKNLWSVRLDLARPGLIGQERLAELRVKWDRLHTARNVLNLAGFGLTVAGAVSARSNERV